AGQCAAHRGLTQMQAFARTRDVLVGEECVERDQEVQIETVESHAVAGLPISAPDDRACGAGRVRRKAGATHIYMSRNMSLHNLSAVPPSSRPRYSGA